MKNQEKEIDKIIAEALSKEEAKYYENLGEQSMFEMLLGVFQGKNKGLYIVTIVFSLVLFGGFVYSAFIFFNSKDIREMLIYGAIGFYCILSVTAVKIWSWMQMDKNAIQRELKRIEIQLVALMQEKQKE